MNDRARAQILISTGPTGGHLFPALSSAESFQREHPEVEVHLLLNRMPSFVEPFLRDKKLHVHVIPVSPLPHFFSFKIFQFLLEYVRAIWATFVLVRELKPHVVIGFGSYGSVPGILCSAFLRVPILLHEQNVVPGRANQFLSLWADRIAVSFPETTGWIGSGKVLWTGYPLRAHFWDAVSCTTLQESGCFTVLVFGGSQGARRLNQVFLAALERIEVEERGRFAVIHIVGMDGVEAIRSSYQRLGIFAEVYSFSDRISDFYAKADLVIARAGAGTIFELAAFGRAAILIPYPYAYAHQKLNAEYVAKRNAVCVVEEQELNAETLWKQISELQRDRDRRARLGENMRRLARRDAGQALVKTGWELTCGRI